VAYVYLSKEILLDEDKPDQAIESAKVEMKKLFQELVKAMPALEQDVLTLNPEFILECRDFDVEMVDCDDWHEGAWNAGYMFDISIKSPNGNPDCDYEIDQWDEWKRLGEPTYKDVPEPLRQCRWEGFKRDDVTVEFRVVKAVDSYSGNGLHFYDNQDWL